MIQNFIGEFMFHPAPLEYSGNTCTHGCGYCFANIRKESRYAKINSCVNQLKKKHITSFTDFLIQNDYPICLSNKTDPFSATDYINTQSIATYLAKKGNGIFWQTKGGHGLDKTLDILKDKKEQVWYITLTTINEDIAKRMERNAPSPAERLELAEKLVKMGFLVILALNPLVEEWCGEKDVIALINRCKQIGVRHIVVEQLHLNKKEIKTFTDHRRKQFTEAELEKTLEHNKDLAYARKIVDLIEAEGLMPMKIGMPKVSHFFDDINTALKKTSPNHYKVINWCDKNKGVLTFSKFKELITEGNEAMFNADFNGFKGYIFKASFKVWKGNDKAQCVRTLAEVLRFHWNEKSIKCSIQHNALFRVLQKDGTNILDNEGNIQLFFDGTVNRDKGKRVMDYLGTLNYCD